MTAGGTGHSAFLCYQMGVSNETWEVVHRQGHLGSSLFLTNSLWASAPLGVLLDVPTLTEPPQESSCPPHLSHVFPMTPPLRLEVDSCFSHFPVTSILDRTSPGLKPGGGRGFCIYQTESTTPSFSPYDVLCAMISHTHPCYSHLRHLPMWSWHPRPHTLPTHPHILPPASPFHFTSPTSLHPSSLFVSPK